MAEDYVKECLDQVRESGLRPHRHRFLITNLRRLLWPLIRPFHLANLTRTLDTERQLEALRAEISGHVPRQLEALRAEMSGHVSCQLEALRAEISGHVSCQLEALRAEISGHVSRQGEDLKASMSELVRQQSRSNGEIRAVVNRLAALEDEVGKLAVSSGELRENLSGAQENVSGLQEIVGAVQQRLGGLQGTLGGFQDHLNEVSRYLSAINGRVATLDSRTTLFPSATNDGVVLLKAGDYISDRVAAEHTWDAHIIDVIQQVARERSGIAVDVGAHIGTLTVAMARCFREVISFEPNDFTYHILVANLALNKLDNVRCVHGALYSRAARLSLGEEAQQEIPLPVRADGSFDGDRAANLGAYLFTENGSSIFPTSARSLDSYGLEDVALIKIDCQGADGEIIAGAIETIRNSRPVIVFEWENELARVFKVSFSEVEDLLRSEGYSIDVLKRHNEKQTDYICHPLLKVQGAGKKI